MPDIPIEMLLASAKAEEIKIQPSRNDKYLPIIHELAGVKKYTAIQIKDWFEAKDIRIGIGYISNKRRLHLESIGEGEDETELQPVATEPATPSSETPAPVERIR